MSKYLDNGIVSIMTRKQERTKSLPTSGPSAIISRAGGSSDVNLAIQRRVSTTGGGRTIDVRVIGRRNAGSGGGRT